MKTRKRIAILMMAMIIAISTFSPTSMAQQEITPGVTSMRLYGEDDDTPEEARAVVTIDALSTVKVGSVIVLNLSSSTGGGFDYEVEPMPPDLMTFDNGKVIVCGTGNVNTTYTFSVSCALAGDSDLAIHKVKVTGADAPGLPDKPGANLSEKVKQWAGIVSSSTKRDDTLKLAQSFSSIATLIADDTFSDLEEMVAAAAISNADALGVNGENWNPFQEALLSELRAMAQQGSLPDVSSHGRVWASVALGLLEYANTIE